jgi:hypothetical protein
MLSRSDRPEGRRQQIISTQDGMSVATPDGAVMREFVHDRTFSAPQETVLDGPRAGMSRV